MRGLAGGAAVGYHRAGFTEIVGVDNRPMPRYPFAFLESDALETLRMLVGGWSIRDAEGLRYSLKDFDAIHASPPCQGYSIAKNNGCHKDAPKLLDDTRRILEKSGKPWGD